jgi:hypothetical protein
VAEAHQRLLLDLTHTLPRDPEDRADLLERHRVLIVRSEIEAEDLRLALLQGAQRLLDRGLEGVLVGLVFLTRRILVRQVVEKPAVLTGLAGLRRPSANALSESLGQQTGRRPTSRG